MAPQPTSMAYFINPSHQSVCLYVHVIRPTVQKNITAATNTYATTEELLDVSFLCGPYCIKRKQVISSSQNFFFLLLKTVHNVLLRGRMLEVLLNF
jgi:hypothetical protein